MFSTIIINSLAKPFHSFHIYFYLLNMYIETMKMNPQYVIIGSVIFVVILFLIYSSSKTFTPYDPETIFSGQAPFEGFSQIHHSQDYVSNKTGKGDMYTPFLINPSTDSCKKVDGFDGLFCGPDQKDDHIDIFSEAKGSPDCVGKSSGLSNSKGGLCLDKNQQNMLLTRGGNQTGMGAQIGN